MSDYASLKVPELKKLLSERALPQAGNKADLIKRLQEDDGAKAVPAGGDSKDGQEEITYDEDDDVAASKPAQKPAAPAAAEPAQAVKPTSTAVSAPAPAENNPAAKETDEALVAAAEEGDAATASKYAKTMPDLAPTDAKTEAQKRAARAARFGIQEEDSEQAKQQQRAQRFGLGKDQINALDSALPDRPAKRGRERTDDGNRDNKRGRGQGRQQGRGNHGGGRNRQDRRDGGDKIFKAIEVDPVEKKKMEDRAKRFAN